MKCQVCGGTGKLVTLEKKEFQCDLCHGQKKISFRKYFVFKLISRIRTFGS